MDQNSDIRLTNEHLLTVFCTYLLTEKMVAHNTLSAYKTDLAQFFQFLETQNLTALNVSSDHIRAFLAYLRDNKVGARSSSRKLSALKLFFTYISERVGGENCVQQIRFPTLEKKLPRYLSEREIADLLRATHLDRSRHALRNKVIIYLLYATGMRISELAQLKITDYDQTAATILLQGKGGKQRVIPVPESIHLMFVDYIRHVYARTSDAHSEPTYLFTTRYAGKNRPITRQALWYIIQIIWARTGNARTVSPHQLRHSMATHMLKNGAHLRSLQMILGHESLATVQVYTHVETSHVRAIYDKKHPRS